jgi:hypothetical protein
MVYHRFTIKNTLPYRLADYGSRRLNEIQFPALRFDTYVASFPILYRVQALIQTDPLPGGTRR